MKTKSFVVALLCVLMALCLVCAACDPNDSGGDQSDGHIHSFTGKWTSDENYHWHAATCEDRKSVV